MSSASQSLPGLWCRHWCSSATSSLHFKSAIFAKKAQGNRLEPHASRHAHTHGACLGRAYLDQVADHGGKVLVRAGNVGLLLARTVAAAAAAAASLARLQLSRLSPAVHQRGQQRCSLEDRVGHVLLCAALRQRRRPRKFAVFDDVHGMNTYRL
eukprot:4509341-Prymnesium_polylepis.1